MERAPSRGKQSVKSDQSEAMAAWTARQAVGVNPVVPAAARTPGTPGHIVLFLAVGVARVLIAADVRLNVVIGGMSNPVLRKRGHCECGGGSDGSNTEKR